MEFDFDNMAMLANEDPVGFAHLREKLIKEVVMIFNDSSHGEQLQAEIDLCRLSLSQGQTTYLAIAEQISFKVMELSKSVAELMQSISE